MRSDSALKVVLSLRFPAFPVTLKRLLATTHTAPWSATFVDGVLCGALVTMRAVRWCSSSLTRTRGLVHPPFRFDLALPRCALLGTYPVTMDEASFGMSGPVALSTLAV